MTHAEAAGILRDALKVAREAQAARNDTVDLGSVVADFDNDNVVRANRQRARLVEALELAIKALLPPPDF